MKSLMRNIGYAFAVAWSSLLFNGTILFPSIESTDMLSAIHIASSVSTGLIGMVIALCATRLAPLRFRRMLLIGGGAVGVLGTCVIAYGGTPPSSSPLIALGYLIAGAGMAPLVCSWRENLLSQGVRPAAVGLMAATVAAGLLYALVALLPPAVAIPLAAAFPLLAAIALTVRPFVGAHRDIQGANQPSGSAAGLRQLATDTPVRLFAAVLLIQVTYGLIRTRSIEQSVLASSAASPLLSICYEIAAVALALLTVLYLRRFNTAIVFYVALPITGISAILPVEGSPALQMLSMALSNTSASLLDTLAFFLLIENVQNGRPALALFGIGILQACRMFGSAIGQVAAGAIANPTAIVIAVFAMLLAAALVVLGGSVQFSLHPTPPEKEGEAGGEQVSRIDKLAQKAGLTAREIEVLRLWGTGHTGSYIERQLGITKNTVKTHLAHIYAKTGTANREELLVLLEKDAGAEDRT